MSALQSATNVTGPYLDLPTATNPFTNEVTSEGPQGFFRLRVDNPLLAGAMQGTDFLVNLAGSPGWLYEVQVSSNLFQWLPLHTNASPFVAKDPESAVWPQRFYRAVLVP